MNNITNPAQTTSRIWPLTPAQNGIWVGQQLAADSARYNTAEYLLISGPLHADRFIKTAQSVLEQAQGLHMAFRSDDALQEVLACCCSVVREDFSNEDNAHECALTWMKSDVAKPCRLPSGELYTAALLQTEQQKWLFYLKIHHIACDGYGFALLIKAILDVYENPERLPTVFGDYKTAVDEQLEYASSEHCAKASNYWCDILQEAKQPITFSDVKSELTDSCISSECTFSVEAKKKLELAAASLHISWSDVVIASVARQLACARACTQVSLGLPTMARMGTPATKVPMMCMNIVPLVIHLPHKAAFSELAKNVAAQISQDRPYHRFRYETLRAHARKAQRFQNGELWGPVVNVMPFMRPSTVGECDVAYRTLSAGPVEDLSITFTLCANQRLALRVDANPNRYTQTEIESIQQLIFCDLELISHNPNHTLSVNTDYFSWWSTPEFDKNIRFSRKAPSMGVWRQLLQCADRYANKIALRSENGLLSYRELLERVDDFSIQLKVLGVKKGALCALALPRSEMAILACLACVKLDCPFVFLDPNSADARNAVIIEDCKPSLLILPEKQKVPSLNLSIPFAFVSGDGKLFHSEGSIQTGYLKEPSNESVKTAYIIYTSGSTGKPKGVLIGQDAMSEFIQSAIDAYDVQYHDHVLQFSPLHFDASIEEIFCSLCSGATLVLRNNDMLNSFNDFCHTCKEWNITVLDLPTAYWQELTYALFYQDVVLPLCVRTVIIGGEAVKAERVQQWRDKVGDDITLFNSYGPTEATVVATVEALNNQKKSDDISLGKPLSGRALAVVDKQLRLLPKGQSGELVLMGSGLAFGYLNLPEATQQHFQNMHLPWLPSVARAYLTGDRVTLTLEEKLLYEGRLDDEIKISGQRIAPAEIESALISLPGVTQAAVTTDKQNAGVQLVAHLAGEGLDKTYQSVASLRRALASLLPAAMLPTQLCVYRKLPLSAVGKVDRKKLTYLFSGNKKTQSVNADDFQLLKGLWQEILGGGDYQPEDDFFAVGGQSLHVIQLANRLSKYVGGSVSANTLFQNPTLQSMHMAAWGEKKKITFVQQKQRVEQDCQHFKGELKSIKAKSVAPKKNQHVMLHNKVLLTGASGFVGAHLLYEILKCTQSRVLCVMREVSQESARERIKHNVERYGLAPTKEQWSRVDVVFLDLQNLGVSPIQENIKTEMLEVDEIYHVAATTSVTRDYQSLRQVNTFATGELLKWAKEYGVPFKFISTIAIAPPKNTSKWLEEAFLPFHSGLSDGYQQSKWAAEKMVEEAVAQGVNACVYRLGRVCGSLSSGYVNDKDLMWQILLVGMRHGVMPDLNIQEPWTPADELASFIVSHKLDMNLAPVYNVVSPDRVFLKQLMLWLKVEFFKFDVLPVKQWREKIKALSDKSILPLLAFFEQKHDALQQGFHMELANASSSVFLAQLERQEQNLSVIDKVAFVRFVEFACKHLDIPRPNRPIQGGRPINSNSTASSSTASNPAVKRTSPRLLSVVKKQFVGAGLIRITLAGSDLNDFPSDSAGSHIKVFLPQAHQAIPVLPVKTARGVQWPAACEKPITRTYSVRAFRELENELDIEFVNHSDQSPASGWALRAQKGDSVGVAGPGGPSPLLAPADWHLLAGDLSALPAIAALLEVLPESAAGQVLLEVDDERCQIPLIHPQGISVRWLLRKPNEYTLQKYIQKIVVPHKKKVSGFIAGESSAVVAMRNYLTQKYGFQKSNLYAVPYWRRGDNEEAYHADRHVIMDEIY